MPPFLPGHGIYEDLGNGFFYFSGFTCQLSEIHFYDSHLFIKRGSVKRDVCMAVKFSGITARSFYNIKSGLVKLMGQSVQPADHWSKVVKAAPIRFEQGARDFL